MKVKEKAAFLANYGCMLTPGMRECKSDNFAEVCVGSHARVWTEHASAIIEVEVCRGINHTDPSLL